MDRKQAFYLEIFLISFAALLLEVSYTRLISFKLFYYYTYVIIGLALLGIGSGGVFVAVVPRWRQIPLRRFLALSSVAASATVLAGYFVIALTPLNTFDLPVEPVETVKLFAVCFALFATFLVIGTMIAALFGQRPETINRLYFADLLGAGAGCAVVVPLIAIVGPPSCILLGATVLAVAGGELAHREGSTWLRAAAVATASLAVGLALTGALPEPVTDRLKTIHPDTPRLFSKWSPVFRIDVTPSAVPGDTVRLIHHDGLAGSTLHRFDGDASSLERFDRDARSYPFRVLHEPPRNVLIIGAAGGHEILASLHFEAEQVTAVELNPVTVSLLTDGFADYSGHLHRRPGVTIINAEGRSFLAGDESRYDLIYFVAPDSYAAMNVATASAFVLSESYLYTSEMIVESLGHLTDRGVICMQFGEAAYDRKPNRTARYVATAREAFKRLGIGDFQRHVLVNTSPGVIDLSTILLKRAPFTKEDVVRFLAGTEMVEGGIARYALGESLGDGVVNTVISLPDAKLDRWYDTYPDAIRPVSDDSPFFWHFARFRTVVAGLGKRNRAAGVEDSAGERLLVIMVATSTIFAAFFLLLPFVAIRDVWSALPRKLESAVYFAGLGFGFMLFEICLIQKMTLLLGYPTYSLTVTLMSLLVFAGLGSLSSALYVGRRDQTLAILLAILILLTLFFEFPMGAIMQAFLGSSLELRVALAIGCMAPLGFCLGAFMPLGLATVSELTEHKSEYVAWG